GPCRVPHYGARGTGRRRTLHRARAAARWPVRRWSIIRATTREARSGGRVRGVISPCGGQLVNLVVSSAAVEEMKAYAAHLPRIQLRSEERRVGKVCIDW